MNRASISTLTSRITDSVSRPPFSDTVFSSKVTKRTSADLDFQAREDNLKFSDTLRRDMHVLTQLFSSCGTGCGCQPIMFWCRMANSKFLRHSFIRQSKKDQFTRGQHQVHGRVDELKQFFFYIYKNIVFPAKAEYFYFSADFRLKMFVWMLFDYSFCLIYFPLYLVFGWS